MDQQTYDTLWHYSEQFTRDKLQRSELVTMAWKQGLKMGERCNVNLMQSVMHFRAKELKIRSSFPSDEMGKSQCDIWNKCYKVDLDRPVIDNNGDQMTSEFLIPDRITPLDHMIVSDFKSKLTKKEQMLLDAMIAGFSFQYIGKKMKLTYEKLKSLRRSLEAKAVMCLA